MSASYTNLLYHIIFSTKNRTPIIAEDKTQPLYKYIGGIVRKQKGQMLEIGGTADHVHILALCPKTLCVAELVKHIKGSSSHWWNEKFHSSQPHFNWQRGYGAFTTCESQVERISHYIQTQEEHHHKMSFEEEFVLFLQRNNIEFDRATVWE